MSENKKHPLTFLIQKYGSTLQSDLKGEINSLIQENKNLAPPKEKLDRDVSKKISKDLWKQELHYFIVEKLLSLGICRMEVIYKAVENGTLHTPKSYVQYKHRKQFIKDHAHT